MLLFALLLVTLVHSQLTSKTQEALKAQLESYLPQNVSTISELDRLLKAGVALKHLGFIQTTKICSLVSNGMPSLDDDVETLYLLLQIEENFGCKLGKREDKIKQALLNFDSDELQDLFFAAKLAKKAKAKEFKEALPDRIKSFIPKLITDGGLSYAEGDKEVLGLKSAMLIETMITASSKNSSDIISSLETKLQLGLSKFWESGY